MKKITSSIGLQHKNSFRCIRMLFRCVLERGFQTSLHIPCIAVFPSLPNACQCRIRS